MDLRSFEQLFKAFSDKQRLRILALLSHGPLVVNDIKNVLHLSMSTVSQHLTILRNAGLVIDNKEGRWVYYSLTKELLASRELPGIVFKELSRHFDQEESFVYDYELLKKIGKPAIDLKKPK